ncbi:hypothetical protein [Erythrobacter sp. Alg231-14]|uniref:hypothetical protein n=1 Tax=Erythrobacter sp. Alg231-14 TaxID=1922225 RepID=UPI000D55D7BE
MIAVTIFLVCFVILVGVVMYLSQTIEHGEARFDKDGKVIRNDDDRAAGPARPAERIEDKDET